MEVVTMTSEEQVVLKNAILIYDREGRVGDNRPFATTHPITNLGNTKQPNYQIMPGTPVTKRALISALGNLANEFQPKIEFVPENVISHSQVHLMWWMPAGQRSVFFNCEGIAKRGSVAPNPALVFLVYGKNWFVFALKKNQRPTENTELFHAPYFNVYDTGLICAGSADTPNGTEIATMAKWEQAFFGSKFTHINGSVRRTTYKKGIFALWNELLDGEYKNGFPVRYLSKSEHTVKSLLKKVHTELAK